MLKLTVNLFLWLLMPLYMICVFPLIEKRMVKWDEYAYAKFKEFKKLHDDEIAEHGVGNLTTEKLMQVFRKLSSYITGLGAGPRYPQNRKYDLEFYDERHS